jgi:ABC-type transporter Mla MlaB component
MSSDNSQFLRKVVKFVANPTTEWSALDARPSKFDEQELGKIEIKAMIERRRRNDFVRKRELEMLRRIRRQNSNPDGNPVASFPSAVDSGAKGQTSSASSDATVKAKIDEIEQQMVGLPNRHANHASGPSGFTVDSTQPDTLPQEWTASPYPAQSSAVSAKPTAQTPPIGSGQSAVWRDPPPATIIAPVHHPVVATSFSDSQGILVNAWTHDAELDEAVIAFANAEFDHCEQLLTQLIQAGANRHDHTDTWMVLFDLYRVLDMPTKFEALAMSFVHRFGLSAPQWYALPERVAAHLSARQKSTSKPEQSNQAASPHPNVLAYQQIAGDLPKAMEGWIAPLHLNEETVSRLQFEVLQLPRPWAMDWAGVETITAQAANQLTALLKHWSPDSTGMTWIGIDQLFRLLEENAPSGDRDADPAIWMLRLELLRFCNRADQFDEVAIDYCITYEQSPPSWEPCACKVKLLADATCTQSLHLSHISDVSTSFVESQMFEDAALIEVASLELSGQLIGDIDDTLAELEKQLGSSVAVALDCTHLIRVDFVAAGDLLNWVLGRRTEQRSVELINPHRLVALFFGAMGITEHAKIRLQTV